ncbi:hypothetical protein ACWGVR_14530 [Streptomyces xanthophaeus]
MPHRPYPNADRALRQLGRHHVQQPVPPSELSIRLGEQAALCLAAARQALLPSFENMLAAFQAQPLRPHALFDPRSGRFALLDR